MEVHMQAGWFKPGKGEATDTFDERVRTILCAIVDGYIATAEPVGSRTLSKTLELGLSPATIRNVMADLTELGYLEQPHTSAGRVPTDLAYRFYVDGRPLGTPPEAAVRGTIDRALAEATHGLDDLLRTTTHVLAEVTRFAGIVASPRVEATRLRLVEFVRINAHKVYAVVITVSNLVHHRIIDVSEDLSQEFLDKVSRYFNEHFAYQSLAEVRRRMMESLVEDKEEYDQMLAHAVRLSKKAFELTDERELYVDGQLNIIGEFNDAASIRRLMYALEEKIAIIELLDQTLGDGGINVAIGLETPVLDLQQCSLITATYGNGEQVLGTIGVVGPTRMDYARVIPVIEYTARQLSEAIGNQ